MEKENTQSEGSKKASAPENPVAYYNVKMYDTPQIAPDGHVNLSEEDIKNRA